MKTKSNSQCNNKITLISSYYQHPLFLKCLGWSIKDDQKLLVFEKFQSAPLDILVKKVQLSGTEKLNMMIKIALAIQFLHHQNLVYGNLSSKSVRIHTEDLEVKLYPIAMSSSIEVDHVYRAPEMEKNDKIATKESDVYSLGVLFLEILKPSESIVIEGLGIKSLISHLDEDLSGLSDLIGSMCDKNAKIRPPIDSVVLTLKEMYPESSESASE
jgi:serine/threonine protein kinase